MTERVYWIGAGASVPYGLPTLKTLTWELGESLSGDDRDVFFQTVQECFRNPLGPKNSPDFEQLLNLLDPLALSYLEDTGLGGPNSLRRRANNIALSGLRAFFREKCANVERQNGPLDVLVSSLNQATIVVSFNWDVLLECALLRAGRAFDYLPSTNKGAAVVLLKPHGSINWFALLDREMLSIATDSNLRPVGEDLTNYMLYVTDPLSAINFGRSSEMVRRSLSPVPAIVPPIASKVLSVGGVPRDGFVEAGHTRTMKATWNRIVIALANASELIVIGYSLPGTDAASIEALRHFSHSGGSAKRILLVERDPDVAERYRSVLDVNTEIVCSDFANFDPARI